MKPWIKETGRVNCVGIWNKKIAEVFKLLGEAHFVETDPFKTASGVEYFWLFEVDKTVVLAFQYCEINGDLLVGTNAEVELVKDFIKKLVPEAFKPSHGLMWE